MAYPVNFFQLLQMSYQIWNIRRFICPPIFIGIGAEDRDTIPIGQRALALVACNQGTIVEAHLYAGLDHSGAVLGSLKDSVPFVRKVMAGETITPVCEPVAE